MFCFVRTILYIEGKKPGGEASFNAKVNGVLMGDCWFGHNCHDRGGVTGISGYGGYTDDTRPIY